MDRKEFLMASGAVVASGLLGATAFAADDKHAAHDHGTPKARPVSKELKAVQDATFQCLKAGELCLAQCNAVLAGGKTSMADCQLAVMNMLAVVGATSPIMVYNTAEVGHLKALARVCADFCRKCEKECKPHANDHQECKDCMQACIDCAKACDAFAKA